MDARPKRTEKVDLDGSDAGIGTMVVVHENVADLYAEADCWVVIGPAPVAEDPASGIGESWFMANGERIQVHIERGDRVSAVSAA